MKASGRGFAIARVSDGTANPDPTFAANWSGIKAAGMVRGVYQFFRASVDPTAQANLLARAPIGTLESGDLPPVADVEVMDGESGATLVANLATWVGVDQVEDRAHADDLLGARLLGRAAEHRAVRERDARGSPTGR